MTEIAVAFDVPSLERALELDRALGPGPEYAKVGLELFASAGPEAVRALAARDRRVFLDLKLHDIPNTVRGAAAAAARHGASLLTVHALGGAAMIAAAVQGVAEAGGRTRVVAVTVLTSHAADDLPPGFDAAAGIPALASRMLETSLAAGAAGIVCAAPDLPALRERHGRPFFAVTPGIRPAGGSRDDQKRVTTIGEAVRMGSGLLVLGRAITGAADPGAALAAARSECAAALQPR